VTRVRVDHLTARLGRLRALPAPVVDGALAAIFLAVVAAERIEASLDDGRTTLIAAALTLVLAGSLALRRRFPLTALLASTAALCTGSLLHVDSAVAPIANQVSVYSAGLYATRNRARWVPLIAVAGVGIYFVGTRPTSLFDPAGVLFVWLATWAIGYSTARRREEQERARRAIRHQVVAEERTRMARELHDVIGHTVNLLVVQAGAARLMLDRDPTMTRDLLTGMEQTGREALAELDRALGTLRAQSPAPDAALDAAEPLPSPGLAHLPALVDRLGDSGVDVTLSLDSAIRLPRTLDLSAYRIVQEALTNALKHAAPCSATVDVHQDGGAVVVEVSDDGPGMTDGHVPGRGLLGIAERVSLCGGVLEHGGGDKGGFTVRAVLPLP
jgi:signal transduction histidine kinase